VLRICVFSLRRVFRFSNPALSNKDIVRQSSNRRWNRIVLVHCNEILFRVTMHRWCSPRDKVSLAPQFRWSDKLSRTTIDHQQRQNSNFRDIGKIFQASAIGRGPFIMRCLVLPMMQCDFAPKPRIAITELPSLGRSAVTTEFDLQLARISACSGEPNCYLLDGKEPWLTWRTDVCNRGVGRRELALSR
jgi:hypothetical protein